MVSWFLRRCYLGDWGGISYSVLVEFQTLKCPHSECERPIVGRSARLWAVQDPAVDEFHYDLRGSLGDVAVLRVTGPRDETAGIFATEKTLAHLDRDQVPADVRARFPSLLTEAEIVRFGTVVGRKVHQEGSATRGP